MIDLDTFHQTKIQPMLVPQIHIVAFGLFLLGHCSHKFDCHHRAGLDTGLLAARASLFIPVGGVQAQIALGGFAFAVDFDPHGSVGLLRTHFQAVPAAYAFIAVDPPDVAVFRVHVGCADRAVLNADRGFTLSAGRHLHIVGKFTEGVLDNLNP